MWAILLTSQCFSRASRRCSSYNLSLGSFNNVDLCLWELCQDDITPGEFLLLQCACQLFWAGFINSCIFMINTDCYIIKRHVSHAWYWFWTIKALVEAVVLWRLYSNSRGHNSSVDHCQTFSFLIIRLAKNLFLRQKCFTDTSYVCNSSVASKRAIIELLAKNLFWEKIVYPLVV